MRARFLVRQRLVLAFLLTAAGSAVAIAHAAGVTENKHSRPKKNPVDKIDAKTNGPGGANKMDAAMTLYDYELPGSDGQHVRLADLKGKVLMIVNLASKSSYNAQLPALEKLSEDYQSRGLVVIGVPSNDFGAGEPDSDSALQKLYKTDDKITFPVMAKSDVTGVHELPLYTWLTSAKGNPADGPVHWNYTKFLVDRTGKVVARFDQDVAPDSPAILSAIDGVLNGTYKPHESSSAGAKNESGASEDEEAPQ